ncbi:MAG: magnesium transporter CorA family protein [Gemmatimonadaceae bacterium]
MATRTTELAAVPAAPLRALLRDAAGATSEPSPAELPAALERANGGGAMLWVDINSNDAGQRALLGDLFHFHPLAIEDALHASSRVKVEEYGGQFLIVVLRTVRFCEETPDDPYDIETINLTMFVGPHYLVTVHDEPAPSVDAVVELVRRNPDLLTRGPARLSHMVADNAVDAFFPILDQVDQFIDGLEERVFKRFDQAALEEIFRVKRLVLSLRRYLGPQRDVFSALSNRPSALLPPADQVYFRDVYDHVLRLNDSLDTFRDLMSGTMDAYLSQVSNRLAQVTKGLSVVATISIPFVVISGMWGMNVKNIPLADHPHAFWMMLALQLGLGVALVAALKWRRLF